MGESLIRPPNRPILGVKYYVDNPGPIETEQPNIPPYEGTPEEAIAYFVSGLNPQKTKGPENKRHIAKNFFLRIAQSLLGLRQKPPPQTI